MQDSGAWCGLSALWLLSMLAYTGPYTFPCCGCVACGSFCVCVRVCVLLLCQADSATVVSALRESQHGVAMVTGDAALTALHVAREVGICSPAVEASTTTNDGQAGQPAPAQQKPALLLVSSEDGASGGAASLQWVTAVHGDSGDVEETRIPLASRSIRELSQTYELVVTQDALEAAAVATDGGVWDDVDAIAVFARMSPHGKARVIRAMQKRRALNVLMCGDGGNDVGALKQADVGLALLSGYGSSCLGSCTMRRAVLC